MSDKEKSEWKVALDTGDIFDIKCDKLDLINGTAIAHADGEIVFMSYNCIYAIKTQIKRVNTKPPKRWLFCALIMTLTVI